MTQSKAKYQNYRNSRGCGKETELQQVFNEIEKENFPNSGNIKASQIQGEKTPSRFHSKRPSPRHIVIKLPSKEYREKILKQARKKVTITFTGTPISITIDFSEETLQARQEWGKIFQTLNNIAVKQRILYPATLAFLFENGKGAIHQLQITIINVYRPNTRAPNYMKQ